MTRWRLFTTTLAVFTSLAVCTSGSAQEWARKMFKKQSHDFGIVAAGTKSVFRFEFENIYKEDVRIDSVSSSCGCTSATIEKQDLKTYEKSAIIAKFNTDSFRNQKQATLTVRISKPYPAEVQLVVRGNIRANMTFDPGSIQFGEVQQNVPSRKVIRVVHRGNTNWQITDVKTTFNNQQIKVALNEVFRGNGVVNYDMIVELQGNVPSGYVQGELFVLTNEGPRVRYPITFTGKVAPDLQLSPEVLTLGPLEPGQEVDHKVVLKASQPFRITEVSTSHQCLRVTPGGEQPNRLQILNIKYRASDTPGKHECEARIATDLGDEFAAVFKTVATVAEKN